MVLSSLFMKHSKPTPKLAPGIFLLLVVLFSAISIDKPIMGLVGLGTIASLAGTLVLVNRQSIWDNYRKAYRKSKGLTGFFTRPNELYYTINVWFLWPFVVFLGLACLWTAYLVSG